MKEQKYINVLESVSVKNIGGFYLELIKVIIIAVAAFALFGSFHEKILELAVPADEDITGKAYGVPFYIQSAALCMLLFLLYKTNLQKWSWYKKWKNSGRLSTNTARILLIAGSAMLLLPYFYYFIAL